MYGFPADLTVAVHVAYVAFVVVGEVLVLAGWGLGWMWVRDFWFHTSHLLALGAVVVVELHGYPSAVKQLLWERPRHERFTINGYREEGTTTTPLSLLAMNGVDR